MTGSWKTRSRCYFVAGAVVVVVVDEVEPAAGGVAGALASGVPGVVVVVEVVEDASGVAGAAAGAAAGGVSVVVVSVVFFSQPAKAVAASAIAASAAMGVFKDMISSPVIGPLSQRRSAKFVPSAGQTPADRDVVDFAINLV
jgi:hypothetical protein